MNLRAENETEKSESKKQKPKVSTEAIRVKRETKKQIIAELAALNKRDLGRPVTPDQYISLAVSLLRPEHLSTLKDQALSNRDRLEKRYRDYCVKHGKVTRDEFIGILLQSGGEA